MPATAQNDGKRALATKLAQIQLKADSAALAEQLTATAVQPVLASWSQRLDETVPPAKQKFGIEHGGEAASTCAG